MHVLNFIHTNIQTYIHLQGRKKKQIHTHRNTDKQIEIVRDAKIKREGDKQTDR